VRIAVLLLVMLLAAAPAVRAAVVEGARVWRAPDHTRLVFDLRSPVEHKLLMLENPLRLVVDLPRSELSASFDGLDLDQTPIARVRSGIRDGGDLRIVLDLKRQVRPRSFVLRANDRYGERLVLDLYDASARSAATPPPARSDRDIVVAIDAGHGGEDPGAIGPGGLKEKHVVLSIARELKAYLDREPGFRGELVRTGDYYVAHKQRRERARRNQADLFVSIHADAFRSPQPSGGSVYALSQRGATSASAAFLAEKENGADLMGGISLDDKDDLLAEVLTDLSMTASLDESLRIGEHVLQHMGRVTRLHKKRVEQAGFLVLKSPDVPSLLIETGFISNPDDARKLNTSSYRRKLSNAIGEAIVSYYETAPPPGTLLASRGARQPREHVIARGDTLSGIAQRYRVSVASIKQTNGLRGNTIRAGQRLQIPNS
jgi:N-acetylmuramoyl-L-alanine amidase